MPLKHYGEREEAIKMLTKLLEKPEYKDVPELNKILNLLAPGRKQSK